MYFSKQDFTTRKPLFLQRNIRKFNSRTPNIKYENGEVPAKSPTDPSKSPSSQDQTTTTPSILTTSTSSIPPPLILPTKNNASRLPERIGQPSAFSDFYVDDQEQVKFNYQTYKTVFCNTTNKGYTLYRYNSLKKAKQVIFHAKLFFWSFTNLFSSFRIMLK